MLVLPAGQDPYGSDILHEHARRVSADLVLTLMDAWVLDRAQLRAIRDDGILVASWMPIDCDPLSAMDADTIRQGGIVPVAMSRHGYRKLTEAGFPGVLYAPHAVDMSVFAPPEDREELRRKFKVDKYFVVGICKSNKDSLRAGFPEQLAAFARLHKRHPDARLSIHAAKRTPSGLKLDELAAHLNVSHAVSFNNQYDYVAGFFTQPTLARWYGSLDLCSNTSYGGGFELALLEAQACGTPVVGTDHSAMSQLCKGGGAWKVKGEPVWNPAHQGWWLKPSIAAIDRVYERAYQMSKSGEIAAMREAARKTALPYNADDVLRKFWVPVMRKLEAAHPAAAKRLDADRDAAVRVLSDAYADGFLGAEEFADRSGRAMGARSAADLAGALEGVEGARAA